MEPEDKQVKQGLKAVCALITNEDNQLLAVSRKDDHDDWGLPGGKVDLEETLEQALFRECLEETGYAIIINYEESPFDSLENDGTITRTYVCSIDTSVEQLPVAETEGLVAYKDPDVLLQGSFKDYNLECFARFNSIVNYKPEDISFEG